MSLLLSQSADIRDSMGNRYSRLSHRQKTTTLLPSIYEYLFDLGHIAEAELQFHTCFERMLLLNKELESFSDSSILCLVLSLALCCDMVDGSGRSLDAGTNGVE
ncbi:hypothetical protein TNCV_743621 [Trichonephila clavipes]|nr:hypothetical protein TNCV_743621 [Trichonephila clavipes]